MSNTAEKKIETKVAEEEGGAAEADICCANCGIAGVDDIKLEECGGRQSVRYCSNKCRELHREQHEGECNNRKALLHDRKLFTQPDINHLGECPICFLPMPLDESKSIFWSCCSEMICKGCDYANDINNGGDRCPFCRETVLDHEGFQKRLVKRVKANDPAALRHLGGMCYEEGDYDGAFEYLAKAAELGDLMAHYNLGYMYEKGEGVEEDEEKAVYYYEKAAIGGHPFARHNLACIEGRNGNIERSVGTSI